MSGTGGVPGPVGTESGLLLEFAQWVASNRAFNGSDYQHGQSLYNECLNAVLPMWAAEFAAALPAPVGEGDGGLEDLLAAHRLVPSWQSGRHSNGWSVPHCAGCKWEGIPSQKSGEPDSDQHRAHLAAQIRAGWVLTLRGGVQGAGGGL